MEEHRGRCAVRRLLVALDGIDDSAAVLPDAIKLARCLGASLLLTHVLPRCSPAESLQGSQRWLARLVQSATARGVAAATLLLEGEPTEQLLASVAGNDIVALAVGSQGDWGNDGGLYGSVADALVRQSPVPVLVTRVQAARPQATPSCFQHVVVPLDGSRLAERAVPDALTLAQADGGRVTLVQAVDRWRPFSDAAASSLITRELQAAGEYVSAVRERYWWVGVPIAVTVRLGPPGQVIRWVAQETAADLIVMATHGRAGLRREQLGSVAVEVLQGDVPLLLRSPSAERPWDAGRPAAFDSSIGTVRAG